MHYPERLLQHMCSQTQRRYSLNLAYHSKPQQGFPRKGLIVLALKVIHSLGRQPKNQNAARTRACCSQRDTAALLSAAGLGTTRRRCHHPGRLSLSFSPNFCFLWCTVMLLFCSHSLLQGAGGELVAMFASGIDFQNAQPAEICSFRHGVSWWASIMSAGGKNHGVYLLSLLFKVHEGPENTTNTAFWVSNFFVKVCLNSEEKNISSILCKGTIGTFRALSICSLYFGEVDFLLVGLFAFKLK